MEAISLPLDDFDLVIDPFQPPGMNRILAVIQDSMPVTAQGFCKFFHCRMVHGPSQGTPVRNDFIRPCPGSVRPEVLEFIFEDQGCIDDFVQVRQLFQVVPIFRSADVGPVSQEKIFGAFEDRFLALEAFRYSLLRTLSMILENQLLSLLPTHAREKSPQGSRFAVFADPNHTAGLVVQNHGQIAVAFEN